jgi:hypothetical protein
MTRSAGWPRAFARARFGDAAVTIGEQLPTANPPGYPAGVARGGTDGADRPV